MRKKRKQGFQESLRGTFLSYALLPTVILLLAWSVAVSSYTFFFVRSTTQQTGAKIWGQIAAEYNAYTSFYDELEADATFMNRLAAPARASDELVGLHQRLYDFMRVRTLPGIFYLFDAEKNLIASNTWENRDDFLEHHSSMVHVLDWTDTEPNRPYNRTRRVSYTGDRECCYTFAMAFCREGEVYGYLVFDLLDAGFVSLAANAEVNYVVITDDFENVVIASDISLVDNIGRFRPDIEDTGNVSLGESSFYAVRRSGDIAFQVFTLTSLSLQRQLIVFGVAFIILSAILLQFVMYKLAGRVAARNSAHLEALLEAVGQLEQGNLEYTIPESQIDEFEYLSDQYRVLVNEISSLLEKNQTLAEVTRETEIKQLQAQFNPHFIFNVLETLKYEIYVDAEKAEQIITLLAKVLRYSISIDSLGNITLGQDMGYIETYLALQKIRYDERLQFSIHMPESLRCCILPKLIIQPLVENCIVHGYNKKETLTVTVTGTIEHGDIILRVTDDGDGICEERLQRVRRHLNNHDDNAGGVGLYNSNRRLQLLYGEDYGVTIFSIEGVGTEVVVTFPMREAE